MQRKQIGGTMAGQVCILLFLVFNSWKDIRKKEISLLTVAVFAIVGIAVNLYRGTFGGSNLAAVGIGAGMILFSLISRGEIGMGDGLLLMALGTVLSVKELLEMLGIGLFCCCIWGILLLFWSKTGKKVGRKTEIPFVPFLLLGYVGGLIY